MKHFVAFSVRHPVTTTMLSAALLLLGALAASRLETALLPDLAYPRLTVVTVFRDESPEGIEKRVTRPVEEALAGVRGLVRVDSSSSQGVSVVRLTFDWKTDVDFAAMEAREKLDLVRNALPQDAERPVVLKYDPNAAPLLSIACTPRNVDDRDLRTFLERDVKPQLQRIEGVGGVKLSGGHVPEVRVDVDPAKLVAVKLTISDLVQLIGRANQDTPAGPLPEGNREVLVRTIGEFTAPAEIAEILISPGKDQAAFRLGMLADVRAGWQDKRAETLRDDKPCVGISVFHESSANQVATAERVRHALDVLQKKHGDRFAFHVVVDRSVFIEEAVTDVAVSCLLGGFLAFVVLLVFLKSWPESVILALSIPICVAATLFLMFLAGITLNVISLGGLALGTGMIVDSGIVVAESIRKRKERGEHGEAAVIEGAAEVATPVFASIWTAIVVFVPILFISGLSGRLFGQMALTVSFSLLVSIFTALSVIPAALAAWERFAAKRQATMAVKGMAQAKAHATSAKPAFVMKWEAFIAGTMKKRRTVFIAALALFAAALPFFLLLDRDFLPAGERSLLKAEFLFPADMALPEKTRLAKQFLSRCLALAPGSSAFTEVGIDDRDPAAAASDRSPAAAQVQMALPARANPADVARRIRDELGTSFAVPFTIETDTTLIEGIEGSRRNQVLVSVTGEDAAVAKAAPFIGRALAALPFVEKSSSAGLEERPELKVVLDRRKAAGLGVEVRDVAASLRLAVAGEVATDFKQGDRRIDVRVRFAERWRGGVDDLSRITLRTSAGELVPLAYLAAFERGSTGSRLFRENGKRNCSFLLLTRGAPAAHEAALRGALDAYSKQHGVFAALAGIEERESNLAGLGFAFALAVLLVYMVMASQFEHFTMPLVVLAALPLSFIGSFALMFVTGTSLNTISAMGMIMLAGLAVNNAIMLYDRFKHNVLAGQRPDDAAAEAAVSRTRPILMTTATAFMGFLPLVLIGASLQRDLAMAAIGGLVTSHGLTLLLLPVFFSRFGRRLGR